MSRTEKNIRIELILLAGLVILLHSLIPHHHHSISLDDYNYSDFSTTQTSGDSTDKAAKHCYAFNNIITEKGYTIAIDTQTESNLPLYFITVLNTIQVNNRVDSTTFFIQNIVPLKQYFSTELSFRGPPALA